MAFFDLLSSNQLQRFDVHHVQSVLSTDKKDPFYIVLKANQECRTDGVVVFNQEILVFARGILDESEPYVVNALNLFATHWNALVDDDVNRKKHETLCALFAMARYQPDYDRNYADIERYQWIFTDAAVVVLRAHIKAWANKNDR